MADLFSMSSVVSLGRYMMTVDMFPVFFTVHFIFGCISVREDSKDLGLNFRQKHPATSWLCSILAVFSGTYIAGFLFGDPIIGVLQENTLVVFFTIIWYLVNYSPWDVVFTMTKSPLFMFPGSIIHEGLRLRFLYLGLAEAARVYPNAPLIILLGGVIKGNGYGFIKIIERLVRGKWDPKSNELLVISYFTKSAVVGCILFLLHHLKFITAPIEVLYLVVYIGFVIGRLVFMVQGMKDPFVSLEAPFCRAIFGCWEQQASSSKSKPSKFNYSKTSNGDKKKN